MVISKMSNIGMRRMKHGGYGPNTEGPNYVLYFKPGQVFKVKYEFGSTDENYHLECEI